MSFGARIYEVGPINMQRLPIVTLAAVDDETNMLTLDVSKVLSVREIKPKERRDYVELAVSLALSTRDISMTLFLTHQAYNGELLRRLRAMAGVQSRKAS